MTSLRFSFVFLFTLGYLCLANGNPISNLFGKSSDVKAEADDKTTVATASTAKSAGEATTTTTTTTATPEPGSSCGGLKGFLHICDKNAPTEPPKTVHKRSAEEDDSDSDEDDDSKSEDDEDDDEDDDNDNDNDEKSNIEEEKQDPTETSSVSSEPTEAGVVKRQVGDPGAPVLGETPPIVANAMEEAKKTEENDTNKPQADESESDSNEDDEDIEYSRRRRDCRDREGDYNKDCRRKREYVPPCFGLQCNHNEATEANK